MTRKIALVSREYPPFFGGGIGTYARQISPALADAGARVHVVTQTYDENHPRVESRGRIAVHRVPMAGHAANWTAAAARFGALAGRKAAELWRRGEADVAEFAECEGAGAALTALRAGGARATHAAPLGPATVVHLHTPTEMLFALRSLSDARMDALRGAYFLAERAAMLAADVLCAPSGFIADWAARFYNLRERPAVIPYAYQIPANAPPFPEPTAAGVRRALFVGRIETRKGVEPLVRAWAQAVRTRPAWRLRLVGADTTTSAQGRSMAARLRSLLPDHALHTVEFVGPLEPGLLRAEYAEASLCIVPSLWENFPNTCIEAMAHARPALVSDEGGMAEMLAGSDAGRTFSSGDVDDLARALGAMLDERPSRLAARGLAARERIARMCDPARVAAARLDLYAHAVDAARAPRAPDAGARLELWRRLRDLGAAAPDAVNLPTLPPRIARWVEPGVRAHAGAAP